MTLVPWSRGRALEWDATCVDTLAPCHISDSSNVAESAAAQAQQAKISKLAPQEQKFYKVFKKCLILCGFYRSKDPFDKDAKLSRIISKMLTIIFIPTWINVVVYVSIHTDEDFYYKGHMYINLTITLLMVVRLLMMQTKKYNEGFFSFQHQAHFSNYKFHNDVSMEVLHRTEKKCFLVFSCLMMSLIFGPISYNFTPALTSWILGAFEEDSTLALSSPINLVLPFDVKYDVVNWSILMIIGLAIATILSYVLVYYDLIQLFTIFHVQGRIEVMIKCLESLDTDKYVLTKEEDDMMTIALSRIVDHHNVVLRSLELMMASFGIVMGANYVYNTIGCCLLLLLLTARWPLSILTYGALTFTIFCQLIGESYMFESLSDSVEQLNEAIYAVPWTAMSTRNQRMVHIIMMVTQKPFIFNAAGMCTVNVKAMASILKATFSYFLWLKTMGDSMEE